MWALNYIDVAAFFWDAFHLLMHFGAESSPLHWLRVGMLQNFFPLVFLKEEKTHMLPWTRKAMDLSKLISPAIKLQTCKLCILQSPKSPSGRVRLQTGTHSCSWAGQQHLLYQGSIGMCPKINGPFASMELKLEKLLKTFLKCTDGKITPLKKVLFKKWYIIPWLREESLSKDS